VWYVSPDLPTVGSEQGKDRPCVIVQAPELERLRTTIVVPLTSKGFAAPFRVKTSFGTSAFALCDHVRAIDRARLRRFAGTLDAKELSEILHTLRAMFTE
jgi:mRNA interferase MazF